MRISKRDYDWNEEVAVRPEGGLYFAYGANISREDMAVRCPTAKPLMPAKINDWRLCFRTCADIEQAPGEHAVGALWHINPNDERILDHFEGVAHGFYYKALLPIDTGHSVITALVYVMEPGARLGYNLPSSHYFRGIAEGYVHWGLPMEPLQEAIRRTEAATEKVWFPIKESESSFDEDFDDGDTLCKRHPECLLDDRHLGICIVPDGMEDVDPANGMSPATRALYESDPW